MRRVVEKVKDIVEVCPFTHLYDFAADPALTLAGYHFTDITADLMAKWIDCVAGIKTGHGSALALAGFRGVGKSHFISVLAAIMSRPDLRSRIPDEHVASSADRLSRRHGTVAFVRRGAEASLLDEVKLSVAVLIGVDPATLSDSLYDLLLKASDHAGESPLVLLIDTALGRDTRVARDDGNMLSEIADAAKTLGIFVAVALDDDISGADGANSSIAASFSIDYLDQEHLYKIVDSHIFSKHNRMLPVLQEIYAYYREVLPGFRWSEQRFTSLYPMHPAILEIAPLIRLYIHDFALLGFAADAGVKILGRPANSLIGLDEVFDGVENKLRSVSELKEAFAAFEKLERDVISKLSVQFRHPAKLILKGLFLLSLNGQGASAAEISASMLIFGDSGSESTALNVAALLESFADAMPKSIERTERENFAAKYSFKLTAELDFDKVLADRIKVVSDDVVWDVLLNQTVEKFADLSVPAADEMQTTQCCVQWRGAIRRGEIVWDSDNLTEITAVKDRADWMILLQREEQFDVPVKTNDGFQPVFWKLAELTSDEKDMIRRHHLLQTDPEVREEFGEGLSKTAHVHSIAVEKIWQRMFLQDALLSAGGLEYKFTDEARSSHGLAQMFSVMLGPVFELQYPSHPAFLEILGIKQSSGLIANFFSGSGSNNSDTQKLAEIFAVPLGLAVKHGDVYIPTASESLAELDFVKSVFNSSGSDSGGVVPFEEISARLTAPPMGLTRETQHLILAALVAQRRYEFVTSSGNRINHRSLDLQILWDDIIGIAKPLNELFAPERLLSWAKLITGNSGIRSLDRTEERLLIIDSLSGWLAGWKENRIIDDFDALPDENLNAGIWRTAANLRKSFGAMAEIIDALVKNEVSLDQCLQSIADLFSDSETDFEKKKSDLRVLKNFTAGVKRQSEITNYLSLCEMTDDVELERSRSSLLDAIGSAKFTATVSGNDQIEAVWTNFKDIYSNFYAERHDVVMKSTGPGEKLREIIRSDQWSTFESFSAISWLDHGYFAKAKGLIREIRQLHCDSKVEEVLKSKPYCNCSFSLSESVRLVDLPNHLTMTVASGLEYFRAKLTDNMERLAASADSDAMSRSIGQILSGLGDDGAFPPLTSQEIRIIKLAADRMLDGSELHERYFPEAAEEYFERHRADMLPQQQEAGQAEAFANMDL